MSRDDAYLLDMLNEAREAREHAAGVTWESFMANRLLQRGLVNVIQNIGEAATKVTPETRRRYPQIPWDDVIGMRHRLVHDYGRINFQIVWQTVEEALPALIAALEPLIPPEED